MAQYISKNRQRFSRVFKKMIRIALIGDVGSGKSYISKLFGYPVFNADKEVSNIYKKDKKCFFKLKKHTQLFLIFSN